MSFQVSIEHREILIFQNRFLNHREEAKIHRLKVVGHRQCEINY